MIELLSPAGDKEKFQFAFLYGADAVYFGGQNFGLRANAQNFSNEEIAEACKIAHKLHKKVFVTVNIIFHDSNFDGLTDYLLFLDKVHVDAIIVSDIAVMMLWKSLKLKMELHVSTQASTLNEEAALFYKNLGAKRIVLAREAMENDIIAIKKATNLDLEAFIHGAMCTSFSGRCVMSNYATYRDANRGGCAQVCRWYFKCQDNDSNIISNNFQMCPKDLNMVPNIRKMIDDGINSFKIEGRMRSIYYISTVLLCYRRIFDKIKKNELNEEIITYYLNILNRCANRESTPQFFNIKPTNNEQYYDDGHELSNQDFLGLVTSNKDGIITIEERNFFKKGDIVQFIGPNIKTFDYNITNIYDENMQELDNANHAQMIIKIKADLPLNKNDIMRVKIFDICSHL